MDGSSGESQAVRTKVKTDVSYAPTKSFAQAFPEEVLKQSEKFQRASWQNKFTPMPDLGSAKIPAAARQSHLPLPDNVVWGVGLAGVFLIGFFAGMVIFSQK